MAVELILPAAMKVGTDNLDKQAVAETVDYLETFPVFKISDQTIPSDGGEVQVFKPVIDWLVTDLQ